MTQVFDEETGNVEAVTVIEAGPCPVVTVRTVAADGYEAQLADELEQLIELDQLPDLHALTALIAPPRSELPQVSVQLPRLAGYDELITEAP